MSEPDRKSVPFDAAEYQSIVPLTAVVAEMLTELVPQPVPPTATGAVGIELLDATTEDLEADIQPVAVIFAST